MSPIITNIVYIIINCFTAFIIHRFMNVFFEKSNCKKLQLTAAYFFYPLITSTAYLIWGIPLITFLCNILSLSLIAALYKGSVKKKISSVVFIYLFMYVIELIFIAASGINHIHITDRSEQVQLIWHILASLITFLASVLAGGFKNIRKNKYSSNMLFVSGIIVPSFSAYLILAIFETGQVKQSTAITSIIFVFAINIIVFYLYDALSLSYEQRIKNELEDSAYTDENDEQAYRINISVICPNGKVKDNSYVRKLVDASKGIFYSDNTQEVQVQAQVMTLNLAANNDSEPSKIQKTTAGDKVNGNIVEILGDGDKTLYPVITSVSLQTIKLDDVLKKELKTDTDKDGIRDWEEVNVELIEKIKPSESSTGTIRYDDLPTLGQCFYEYSTYGPSYVVEGFNQLMSNESMSRAFSYPILPIHSNPADADSDGDGIPDCIKFYDTEEYKNHKSDYYVTEFDDPNPLKFEYLWQWPLLDTDGNKVSRITSGFYEKRKHDYYHDYHSAIDISATDKNGIIHSDYQVVAAYDGILKSVKEISWGGCTIEIEHTINGRKYISRYCHMLYYDNGNENHEFVQYINEILEQRGNEETFSKNIWGEKDMAGKIQDVTKYNIHVKAGTPIGIASGTKNSIERDYYGKHLDFRIDDSENNRIINPISFCQSLSSSKIDRQEYKCDMLINVPIDLCNACKHDDYHEDGTWCDCKEESEGGEAFDIRKLYKIKYNIEKPNIEEKN